MSTREQTHTKNVISQILNRLTSNLLERLSSWNCFSGEEFRDTQTSTSLTLCRDGIELEKIRRSGRIFS